jgi:hypothetical protein
MLIRFSKMLLWITHAALLMTSIAVVNSLNELHQQQFVNSTGGKRVSAKVYPSHGGDFKIGVLVSVRLHTPGKKNTRNLECGKVTYLIKLIFLFIALISLSHLAITFSFGKIKFNQINCKKLFLPLTQKLETRSLERK